MNTHKTNDTSLLALYVVKSTDADVIGDVHGILLLCISSPDLHLILDRFFFCCCCSFTKSVYQHFFSFSSLSSCSYICLRCFFAGVQNIEYHHIEFHCTKVNAGVIRSLAKQGQLEEYICAHAVCLLEIQN